MALGTIAEQITALEAELVLVKAQLASTSAGGQNFSLGGMSVGAVNYAELMKHRKQLERDLQRLYRGGRGMVVDHSSGESETPSSDNTVYTRVQA